MEPGTYDNVEASNARLIESPKTGTPGVEIDFTNEHGEQLSGVLWLTEKALKRSVESLRHMGWRGDDLSDLSTVGLKKCQIVVDSNEYGPNVKWVNANNSQGGGEGFKPMADDAKKRFAAAMRGQIVGVAGKASAPAQRGTGGAPKSGAMPPRPPADYQPEPPVSEEPPF